MATVADTRPSLSDSQKASTISWLAHSASNQRSDKPPEGSEMKPSPVKDTAITTTSGATMKAMKSV